jgi:TonB family protein
VPKARSTEALTAAAPSDRGVTSASTGTTSVTPTDGSIPTRPSHQAARRSQTSLTLLSARSIAVYGTAPESRTSYVSRPENDPALPSVRLNVPLMSFAPREPCANEAREQVITGPVPMLARIVLRGAELLTKAFVQYPAIALQQRAEGRVIVHAVIAPDGSIKREPTLEAPTSNVALNAAAVDSVRGWRFRPRCVYEVNGGIVQPSVTAEFNFVLTNP